LTTIDSPASPGSTFRVEQYFLRPAFTLPPQERESLNRTIEDLTAQLNELNAGQIASDDQIRRIEQAVQAVSLAGDRITAPVVLPHQSEIEVRLVPLTLLSTLSEHQTEENRRWGWMGIWAGGWLGIVVSMVLFPPNNPIPTSGWLFFGTLLLLTLKEGWEWKRAHDLTNQTRERLLRVHNGPASGVAA